MKPAPPLGLYDLYVVENPREMSQPPPRDIFGGDTPMGIGEAGASEPVEWQGRDEDAEWAMAAAGKAGGEYAWPEESEGEGEVRCDKIRKDFIRAAAEACGNSLLGST